MTMLCVKFGDKMNVQTHSDIIAEAQLRESEVGFITINAGTAWQKVRKYFSFKNRQVRERRPINFI